MTLDAYLARLVHEKWCIACKGWHSRSAFGKDASRTDGLDARCLDGRVVRGRRPGHRERRLRAQEGLAWCSPCAAWLALSDVRAGKCRDHRNEYGRQYYSKHPHLRDQKRARHTGVPSWWRDECLNSLGGKCAYACGRSATDLEHVLPITRGGKTTPSNLVPSCKWCNGKKQANDPSEWIKRGLLTFPDFWEAKLVLAEEHGIDIEVAA
jgi:hypothetical protein